jgi:small subunit ribosomal protein S6e
MNMVEFKFVINDGKTGKSYQKALEDSSIVGKKLGETISGNFLGLEGYELEIRGGTDLAGFPMKRDIQGSERKRALLSSGVGINANRAGLKRRKTVCGNTISEKVVQINLKVKKYGAKALADIFAAPTQEAPKAE